MGTKHGVWLGPRVGREKYWRTRCLFFSSQGPRLEKKVSRWGGFGYVCLPTLLSNGGAVAQGDEGTSVVVEEP